LIDYRRGQSALATDQEAATCHCEQCRLMYQAKSDDIAISANLGKGKQFGMK